MRAWFRLGVQWMQNYFGFDDVSLERATEDAKSRTREWWAANRYKRWLAVLFIHESFTFGGLWLIRVIFGPPHLPIWYRWILEMALFGAMWLLLHWFSVKMTTISIKEARRFAFWSGAFFWAMAVVPAIALFQWLIYLVADWLGW